MILLLKIFKKIRKYLIQKNKILSKEEAEEHFFCFTGEFGYELISWIPYLLFIKERLKIKIQTIGRPGSKIFYYFSDNHTEIEPNDISHSWGEEYKYLNIKKRLNLKKIIYPSNFNLENKTIKIDKYEWQVKDIHKKIDDQNYKKIDLSNIKPDLPFYYDRKIIVINNKYAKEWGEYPINFFSKKDLEEMKSLLTNKGYFLVYNAFIEETHNDKYENLDDKNIFISENCYDMREFYKKETKQETRNLMQISLYNKASFVIGVQGGNIYLPAICKKNIVMLMKKGDYIDYRELSRIYNVQIEVFYETKHILEWLKNKINL